MIDHLSVDLLTDHILSQLDSASLLCCMLTSRHFCQAVRITRRQPPATAASSQQSVDDDRNADGFRPTTRVSDVIRAGPSVIGWARSTWEDFPWNASLFGMAVALTKNRRDGGGDDGANTLIADDLKTLEFLRKEDCPFYVGALFNESLERGQISVAEWIYSTANSDEHVLPKLRYLASKRAANASVAWVGGSPLDAIRMLASFCLDHVDSVEFLRAAAETGNRSMIKAISLWIDGVSDALAAPLKPWPLDEQSILLAACKAATNGHIHVLEWLEQSPFRFNLAHPSVTKKAAEGQQQHVIEFLRRKEVLQNSIVASAAASGGHLDLLLWAMKEFSYDMNVICHAAASGCHVHILEHLSNEGHANATGASVFFSLLRGCALEQTKLSEGRVLHAISWLSANGCDKGLFRCECRPVLETGIALKSVPIVHSILGVCSSVEGHFPLENIRLAGMYYVRAAERDFEALFHKIPITEQEWEISNVAVVSAVAGRGNLRLLKHLLRVYRIDCDAAQEAIEAAENKKQMHVLTWLRKTFAKE